MYNNDILRRLRYALKLTDAQLVAFFAPVAPELTEAEARSLLARKEDEGSFDCTDVLMTAFLDSLILDRRGPAKPGAPRRKDLAMTNNLVLKKLRIALTLLEEDMLSILELGGQPMSRPELTALFRKPDHKHYRACGDQAIRAFLRGLSKRLRPSDEPAESLGPPTSSRP